MYASVQGDKTFYVTQKDLQHLGMERQGMKVFFAKCHVDMDFTSELPLE